MSCPNTTTHYNAKAVVLRIDKEMFWAVTTAIRVVYNHWTGMVEWNGGME